MTDASKLTSSDNMINKRNYFNFYVESYNLTEDILLFCFASLNMSSLFICIQLLKMG